ncbi:MAG TPA: CDP-glycerol glycerophosphotransferase family protein [Lactobacillaceae bacterium]
MIMLEKVIIAEQVHLFFDTINVANIFAVNKSDVRYTLPIIQNTDTSVIVDVEHIPDYGMYGIWVRYQNGTEAFLTFNEDAELIIEEQPNIVFGWKRSEDPVYFLQSNRASISKKTRDIVLLEQTSTLGKLVLRVPKKAMKQLVNPKLVLRNQNDDTDSVTLATEFKQQTIEINFSDFPEKVAGVVGSRWYVFVESQGINYRLYTPYNERKNLLHLSNLGENQSLAGYFSINNRLAVYLTETHRMIDTIKKRALRNKVSLHTIEEVEGQVRFVLDDVEHVEADALQFEVYNRKSKEKLDIRAYRQGNQFITSLVSLTDFPVVAHTNFDVYDYDQNIFDFWYRPIWDALPEIDLRLRLREFDNIQQDDEHWVPLDANNMQLLSLYNNANHKLSARFSFLPNSAYKRYIELKNKMMTQEESSMEEKPIVLVSEYVDKAQDTGLAFFEYLMRNRREEVDAYYVINQTSPDLKNLREFENNIVYFRSAQHVELMFNANVIAHSHSSLYAYPVDTEISKQRRKAVKKVFLQHGIILGVRNLSTLYGKNDYFTNRFIVSSEREKELVLEYGYQDKEVVVTGLSRFDKLMAHRHTKVTEGKRILVMPSWRKGQNVLSDEEFQVTHFFLGWHHLLASQAFKSLTENVEVSFYLHHNFQHFSHLFEDIETINVIKEGEHTVQELMIDHDVLITDFSSVGNDFSLLNRKVLYYNFDKSSDSGDLEALPYIPGDIYFTETELLSALTEAIENPALADEFRAGQAYNLYAYEDQKANDRIYRVVRGLLEDD